MNEYDVLLSKSKLLENNPNLSQNECKQINIKTKTVTQIVIENNSDLKNTLEFLRYHMIDDIPTVVVDYIRNNYDECKYVIDNFKDYHYDFLINCNVIIDARLYSDILSITKFIEKNQYNKVGFIVKQTDVMAMVSSDNSTTRQKQLETRYTDIVNYTFDASFGPSFSIENRLDKRCFFNIGIMLCSKESNYIAKCQLQLGYGSVSGYIRIIELFEKLKVMKRIPQNTQLRFYKKNPFDV